MKTKKEAAEIVALMEKEYPLAECSLDNDAAWQLLVAVRLSAQCKDSRVNEITPILFSKFPTVDALADAPLSEIIDIVKPCGLGNTKGRDIKLCMTMLRDEYNGIVPDDFNKLLKLPGVGRKSANLIVGDVFGKPAVVADTHCIRISNRLGFMKKNDPQSTNPVKVEMQLKKVVEPEKQNDLCHRFVEHGRRVCTARKAYCDVCILNGVCDYKKEQDKIIQKKSKNI